MRLCFRTGSPARAYLGAAAPLRPPPCDQHDPRAVCERSVLGLFGVTRRVQTSGSSYFLAVAILYFLFFFKIGLAARGFRQQEHACVCGACRGTSNVVVQPAGCGTRLSIGSWRLGHWALASGLRERGDSELIVVWSCWRCCFRLFALSFRSVS